MKAYRSVLKPPNEQNPISSLLLATQYLVQENESVQHLTPPSRQKQRWPEVRVQHGRDTWRL